MNHLVVGLKRAAETYLRDYGVPLEKYAEVTQDSSKDHAYPLHRFQMPDGYLWEISQEMRWMHGWVVFTCLEDDKGDRLYEWTENEMREYL